MEIVMTSIVEAYTQQVSEIHRGGNLAAPGDSFAANSPREVRVSRLGWVIIWFKDRLMPSSTRATHEQILSQLERTVQSDTGCPLKGDGAIGLINRSFDRKTRNRSWPFVQRLQKVSEELQNTVDDPLLQGLDGSQMQFTMETYPTEDNFRQMLQQMQLAHEARSKAQAPDTACQGSNPQFGQISEISREDYIQFLKYIHKNTSLGDREQSKSEPQLALAAMLTYRLAFPSPTQGKRRSNDHWDRSLDGAFYGCRDMNTAGRYYTQYMNYNKNRPRGGRTLPVAGREGGLFTDLGRVAQEPPISSRNANNPESEIEPVQVVPTPVSDSVTGSVSDESVALFYGSGVVLGALSKLSKQARAAGGAVNYNKSTSELTVSHCSRFGKLVVRLRDKAMPGRSSEKNSEVLRELDRVLKLQFGFSKENAQVFLDREFTPDVLSDTPRFVNVLAETTSTLFGAKNRFASLGSTSLVFGENNVPTYQNFEFKASTLLPVLNNKIGKSATGATGDHSPGTSVHQGVASPSLAENQAFIRYRTAALGDVKAFWGKYLDFLCYLDKNMPQDQRINDFLYKSREADIALSVFLLHEGLDHKYASASMHSGDLVSFSDSPGQVIGNFTDCHRQFAEETGRNTT